MVNETLERAHVVFGIITNSCLLYLIRRHTRVSLGVYKQLLTVFASYDLILTALHGAIEPKLIIVNTTLGIASTRLPSLYCASFTVPFTLMNIHFLYRCWAVRSAHLIPLFSRWSFILFLALIPLGQAITWYFLCIFGLSGDVQDDATEELRFEFEKRDGMNITKGWIVMDHWRNGWEDPRLIVILSMFDVVIICSLILALTLGTLTYSAIRRTRKISSNKKNIHLTLLIAVTAQTIVPFIFVYIPYFFCINFPYFRIPIGILAELSSFLTSCFPAWDAVIVILLFADYRTAVWSVVRRWGTVVPVKERHSMMTASLTTF